MHLLAQEILLQWSLIHMIILKCNVPISKHSQYPNSNTKKKRNSPICTECTRQHSDIPKHALQRFIEDITHLVLKILSRNQRVQEVDSEFTLEGDDFATGTSDV